MDSPRTRAISPEQITSDQGHQVNSGLMNGTTGYYGNAAFLLQRSKLENGNSTIQTQAAVSLGLALHSPEFLESRLLFAHFFCCGEMQILTIDNCQ